ncbi:MAG: glycosyltransferase family 39 protein [Cyanobacteria bacterium P01_E01_bin.45]
MTRLDRFDSNAAQPRKSQVYSRVIVLLIVVFVLVGGFFRFNGLGRKFPWMDECLTQVRVTEYDNLPAASFPDAITTPISVDRLISRIEEKPQQSLAQLIDVKLSRIPEHPPLYYLLAAKAASLFGNNFVVLRGLASCISLLAFPAMYWLCLELFGSPLFGTIGIGVASLCPIYVLYAQEAREYSLWIVAGMFSSAALLRSLRTNRRTDWLVYSLTLVLGLYTHLFFVFNILAHVTGSGLTFLKEKAYSKSRGSNFIAAVALNCLAFAPWGLLFFRESARVGSHAKWFSGTFDVLTIAKRIMGSFVRTIYDFGFSEQSNVGLNFTTVLNILPLLLTLTVIGISFVFVLKTSNKLARYHILALVIIPIILTMLGESLTGKVLTQTRYLMPTWLGVQLALIYFIRQLIARFEQKSLLALLSKVVVTSIVAASFVSCVLIANADYWWSKGNAQGLSVMAEQIEDDGALIFTNIRHVPSLLRLAHQLDPQTKLQFSPDFSGTIPDGIEHTYFVGGVESAPIVEAAGTNLKQLSSLPSEVFTLYEVGPL